MVRLGQNFLADPNLLDAIVRDAELEPDDVALEIGGGEGVLTERIAKRVAHVHVVELDEELGDGLEELAERAGNVSVVRGDAMRLDLAALDPAPTTVPSNLPYSVATPVLLRTIAELPGVARWTVMVQREIADRLRAEPGTPAYGSPSVFVQLACEVELIRTVNRAVFRPRPRVDSALVRLRRLGPAPAAGWRGSCATPSPTGESRSRARWSWPAGHRAGGAGGAGAPRPRAGRPRRAAGAGAVRRARSRAGGGLTLRAPAKLNLCLYLGRPRDDGLHELRSLFCPLTLSDRIVVSESEADEVVCPGVDGPNLADAALAGLRARGWSRPPVRIEIEKRIPVAAGLGGGSADAAARAEAGRR